MYEMLLKFRMVCISGYCALGCQGSCTHSKQIDRTLHGNFSNLPCKVPHKHNLFSSPCCLFCFVFLLGWLYLVCFFNLFKISAAFVLPSRGALCLGDRVIMYLPRCADTNAEVRKVSAQVC